MDVVAIVLIAIGLAMDAFAVSIASGITIIHQRRKNALLMASFFGTFQMLMPMIGWSVGLSLRDLIIGVDHWIAFGLLAFIGSKMIYDSTKKEDDKKGTTLRLSSLLTLSVATSIDALMVGLSFAFLQAAIAVPILVIGLVTFSLSFTGFMFGCAIGNIFGNKIKILGGLMLIAIGIKILLDHLLL
jgi:manganese efflux pump family protein